MKCTKYDFEDGDHIVYKLLGETFYAVIKDRDPFETILSDNYVTIMTLYCMYEKYNENLGPSDWSELDIEYITAKVESGLSRKELFDKYPEYII